MYHESCSDGLRATALSAAGRLLRRTPALVAPALEQHGVRFVTEGLASETNAKIQQAVLTMLLLGLRSPKPSARLVRTDT